MRAITSNGEKHMHIKLQSVKIQYSPTLCWRLIRINCVKFCHRCDWRNALRKPFNGRLIWRDCSRHPVPDPFKQSIQQTRRSNINHILRDHLSNEHINKRQNAKTKLENTLKFRTIQRKVDFIDGQQERSGGIDKVGRSTANKLRCDLICKRTFCRVAHFSNFISPLVFLAILSRCPPYFLPKGSLH